MKKIRLELMKPFITEKLNTLMPIEDDVIIVLCFQSTRRISSWLTIQQVPFYIKN